MECIMYVCNGNVIIYFLRTVCYILRLTITFILSRFARFSLSLSRVPSQWISFCKYTRTKANTHTQTGLPKSDMHACINYICLFGGSGRCSNRIHLNLLYIFFILPSFGILFICIYLSLAFTFFLLFFMCVCAYLYVCLCVCVKMRVCVCAHDVLFFLLSSLLFWQSPDPCHCNFTHSHIPWSRHSTFDWGLFSLSLILFAQIKCIRFEFQMEK